MKDLKVVFMGTPDFSVPVLEALIQNTNVVMVVTQPDKLVGRKKELTPSPVKKLALEHNITVFQPAKIREDYQPVLDINPDIIITCAYGQIIPKIILDNPKYGCVNVHASLLPKYRGGAPIHKCLIDGEEETGITIMYMDEGMDTGDMIDKVVYEIKDSDDIGTLHEILSKLGGEILDKNLENLVTGKVNRVKQNDEEATFAPMIEREMEELNFNDLGKNVVNKIRAFSPWPLCKTKINEEEIKIVKAHFENEKSIVNKLYVDKNKLGIGVIDGIVYFDIVKPVGKNNMDIKNYLNGKKGLY